MLTDDRDEAIDHGVVFDALVLLVIEGARLVLDDVEGLLRAIAADNHGAL